MTNFISFLESTWKECGARGCLCPRFPSFLIIFLLLEETHLILGGNCWIEMNPNGRCTSLVESGVSREDCCNSGSFGGSATAAWSEGERVTPSSFFYMHLQGGVPCTRCNSTCDGVQCPEGQKCVVRNGTPKCSCTPDCSTFKELLGIPNYQGLVCGTDGRTYQSPCRLLRRACQRKDTSLAISYLGPCQMSCEKVTCLSNKLCLLDQNMRPHCVNCIYRKCPVVSEIGSTQEFCGVDEVTYPSMCHLRQAACKQGRAIPVAYRGICKKQATCANVNCSESQTCLRELDSGKPRCVTCSALPEWCKVTTNQFEAPLGPICSTNGRTYKNWCEMKEDACSSGTALDTEYFGECRRNSENRTESGEENGLDFENESTVSLLIIMMTGLVNLGL